MKAIPPCLATAVGSVPFTDLDRTLDLISILDAPPWPQMVQRDPREDMVLQAVDGLPALELDLAERKAVIRPEDRETALAEFYERFLQPDLESFQVPSEAEIGLTGMLRRADRDPDFGPEFIKAQIIGPVSFGLSVHTPEGLNLVDDPDLFDAAVKGLGLKAAWLAGQIRNVGRTPILFLDEPGLSGYGSAFSTLQPDQVKNALDEASELARSQGEAWVGIHVCGNTDWGLMASTGIDIINLDAYQYLDQFLLYPNEIKAFLERGGYVAWGVVPTLAYTGQQTARQLADHLSAGWKALAEKGVDLDLIRQRSLITPSCGTGALSPDVAEAVYRLIPETARLLCS
jgi:hypothetical protein